MPQAVLIQVMVALGVPLAAGYFPVNRGAKTTVRRAISEERPGGQLQQQRIAHQARRPVEVDFAANHAFNSKYFPAQRSSGFYVVHTDHGWSDIHLGV